MKFYFSLIAAILCVSCQSKKDVSIFITNISIVDVKNGEIISDQFVAIQGDSILEVGDQSLKVKYQSNFTINGDGKFLLPGLWDNHVHFGGAEYIDENEQLLPLYLAFGVTTVRDAAGDISLEVLKWRDEINQGKRIGPKILTSGPKLEGINSIWPGDLEIGTVTELEAALDSLEKLKVDFIKITDNTLKPELFLEAVKQATERGWSVSGHIPTALTIDQVSKAGQKTVEHLGYLMRMTTPFEEEISIARGNDTMNATDAAKLQSESRDDSVALTKFKQLAAQGTGVVPTLLISSNIAYLEEKYFQGDTILNYLGPKLKESYQWRIQRMANDTPEDKQNRKDSFEAIANLIPLVKESGMKIYAGTDAGYLNTYDYPGLAIHLELQLLVKYGLTPREALEASIINGPEYFGLEKDFGSVQKGKKANLLILNQNPLENIEATLDIQDVLKDGQLLDRIKLNQILAEIKAWVAKKENG
ncbi:amidohydrolase family protein [Algoriphagus sp.]|uniref:amidohydrolase family protein n=1 Tax=Algoriphagus sp. TaxID=1872435 RepID=UPI0025EFB894|nr:amidohydrolase family protein [Algoriphagus sp.]